MEFPIAERRSVQRFLGIGIEHTGPDYRAVRRFREILKGGVIEDLFTRLGGYIDTAGFEARKGQTGVGADRLQGEAAAARSGVRRQCSAVLAAQKKAPPCTGGAMDQVTVESKGF